MQELEGQFRALVDAIPQLCWMANADGWIFWYNQRWHDYTGTTLEQMEGWGWQSVHDPDALPSVMQRWDISIATAQPFDMTFPLRRKDGVFRSFLTRVMPFKDAEGKVIYWFGTNTDVDDQRETEAELRRSISERELVEAALQISQRRLEAIIGSAMDAIITVGADQRILVFNAAAEKIFGCSAAEVIGSPLDRFIPASLREAHRNHLKVFGVSGTTSRSMYSPGILSGLRANGEEFPIEATISQVTVSGEKLFTVILRDVTERKRSEDALIRSEKLASVGRMAATIAHEINNPLAAVTNVMFLLQGMEGLPEPAKPFLELVDAELQRIAHITRQSLGFYREFDKPVIVSITTVLESAVDLMKSKIKTKQAAIETEWNDDVEVAAIAGELRQVFSNLLNNSLDAIEEGGTVKLRISPVALCTETGNRRVRIMVADNGRGINKTSRPSIFEPFFTTKGTLGTGLGLWVTKQIVDKHHGIIRVRSSCGGAMKGTTFSVVLPVTASSVGSAEPTTPATD